MATERREPPTPEQVRALRDRAGLTQRAMARLVHTTERRWREWEAGTHRMMPGLFELAEIKVDARAARAEVRA